VVASCSQCPAHQDAQDLMSYRDLPFPEKTDIFPDQGISSHSLASDRTYKLAFSETILRYLQAYAESFDLSRHIRFNTRVSRLYHTPSPSPSPGRKWTIESHNVSGGILDKEQFDFVCVSNGHYSDPWVPKIPGLRSASTSS
jgi:cation diffusion facilitator CzcD-associated flavoprotein CzcO